MEIQVTTQDVELPDNGAAQMARRVSRRLARLRDQIARLHLTLKDASGAQGGRDKVCMLRAELVNGGEVIVIDRSRRMLRAFLRCLRRARTVIAREASRRKLERRRLGRRLAAHRSSPQVPAAYAMIKPV